MSKKFYIQFYRIEGEILCIFVLYRKNFVSDSIAKKKTAKL